MQIILIHPRKTGAVHLSRRSVVAAIGVALLAVAALSGGAMWLAVKQGLVPGAVLSGTSGADTSVTRENLNLMAARIGEMQAQMVRLDALGARVSGLAGVPPREFDFKSQPGRGGPQGAFSRSMSMPEIQSELDRLTRSADQRNDYLSVLESTLMDRQIHAKMMPTVRPVAVGYDSSGFGTRIDPFTGRRTQHDGVDFVAPVGTPIVAAAGGVVVASEYRSDYGNMVDIDHGNGLKTRYAHASKVFVKIGDIVKAGERIALVGRTGRATGSHLHFEVHVNDVPQNPVAFLENAGQPKMAATKAPAQRVAAADIGKSMAAAGH
ncbi:M23 family metallopeptidase [Ralstonia insidiosa]|jgi:murein DD-endopeptidase MepM/ murein hydrolase activator NlpD|uniref:M23 family metallopeptidase n=1 Tax=Ralstonia TaxID=48736 RepID=UPI0006649483|nr:M23 family metallopeptidase [Ralstonia insidiosa]KMW47493.1 peptidase M23 [Ralstonia sp. MD27]MBX3773748.1 M23 family metallopeptidase [Ralstonia pickettii]NOZ17016.1 M23 family metallopeptidase [Betaproteobacteria bacterium]MBA9857469.1 M23 family metallopeptidase [Ralstonia insidiosa]MBA9914590.1 M23 family metallopeptidase [Ralstonia insidiosa]